ncbi:DUF3306 domain-containing protein [Vibrio scophthalmi]|uniref:DUF3306 domain-containing protein n=1 Tax=Vibrio scophthalmi TaxID=45658 RepID=UPI003EC0F2B0
MATNFFSRWSQRKLNKETDEPSEQERIEASAVEVEPAADDASVDVGDAPEALASEADQSAVKTEHNLPNSEAEQEVASAEEQDPEKMSLANLLVSQVEESAKKAAMRKLFMSEEFNIRDGLDDYDEDYSNLKALSQGVAETLRDWVKEKPEEEEAALIDSEVTEEADVIQSTEKEDSATEDNDEHEQSLGEGVDKEEVDPLVTANSADTSIDGDSHSHAWSAQNETEDKSN